MAKKPRYFLHLAYKGTAYNGWQIQAKGHSVQGEIERCLSALLHQPTKIHPCGRTDAGVHASQFFAHFEKTKDIDFDLAFRMNKMLPKDIAIYDLLDVPPNANAQLDAQSRTYEYRIHREKNPFLEDGSACMVSEKIDHHKIEQAIELLEQQTDFRSMCLTPDAHPSTLCAIEKIELKTMNNDGKLLFTFIANRFLRGMVRLLVARLWDVGTGKLSLDELKHALDTGERVRFHTSAPPQGLYLAKIIYPYLEEKQRHF